MSSNGSPTDDGSGAASPDAMSPSLMARLFGIPLLIIGVILGCAVMVVLLFGSIATEREQSISSLLSILESHSAEKTAGVLLPNEKELWQAGRYLALRLRDRDTELTPDEVSMAAERLAGLLVRDAAVSGDLSEMGRAKMHFVMRALALTGSELAVDPIVEMFSSDDRATRQAALASLTELVAVPGISRVLRRVIEMLDDPDSSVGITACACLSVLGGVADDRSEVIEGLGHAYFSQNREIRWNAALALARLGSAKGKPLILDMLDRSYWQNEVRVRKEVTVGQFSEYPMSPGRVVDYLVATIVASQGLDDAEIRAQIDLLTTDASAEVKNAALQARARHEPSNTSGVLSEPQTEERV